MTARNFSRRRTLKLAAKAAISGGLIGPLSACSGEVKNEVTSFDYIIVGAGSAGCVLAARLSKNPNTRVLLLEAGPSSNDPLIDDPKNWFRLTFGDYVWPDKGMPQSHAGGKDLILAHGKLVGGSSAINAMIHHRPTADDLDDWNLPNWRWKDIAPMLERSETWNGRTTENRGDAGPIKVMALPDPPLLAETTLAAAERLGYGASADLNGTTQLGAGLNQLAFDGSKRQHTGYAYLRGALDRSNLFVETSAHATQLLFAKQRCTGVEYDVGGVAKTAEANRIILCAGTLRSPAILMRSGIGPSSHLKDLGIPIRVAAQELGLNLHDHMLIAGHNFATENQISQSEVHGSVAVVYGSSEAANEKRDLMLNVSTTPTVLPPLNSPKHGFKTTFSFTKPKSRGHLKLASLDPFTQPIIDHNIFSAPEDMNGALAALEISREILNSDEFRVLNGVEQNQELLKTLEGRRQLIISGTTPFGHHCGTCRMGLDDGSIVDETLRVKGTEGLYVIDASVIPEVPSCPTNALVIAMAELAASRLVAS